MTMIVYDPKKGSVTTDSFTSVNYPGSLPTYEAAKKTWVSKEGDLFFTVLGAQPWVKDDAEGTNPPLFEKYMRILKDILHKVENGDMELLETVRSMMNGTYRQNSPYQSDNDVLTNFAVFLSSTSFIAMTRGVVVGCKRNAIHVITDNEFFVGVDEGVFEALRNGGLTCYHAFNAAVYVSDSACFPLDDFFREQLKDTNKPQEKVN